MYGHHVTDFIQSPSKIFVWGEINILRNHGLRIPNYKAKLEIRQQR